nr:aldehyde ferredoxin oxidoreductase C-terminal domain-containing protein [Candidatus Freyrarchaeum guaymaensis]
PAGHVGYLTGARHSHLDSGGYSLDEKTIGATPSPEEIANKLFEEESWRQILSSLVVCFFARRVYSPETVAKALKAVGLEKDEGELAELGREILFEKYRFKVREGFSFDKLRIPRRILETPTPHGMLSEEVIREAVAHYASKIKL